MATILFSKQCQTLRQAFLATLAILCNKTTAEAFTSHQVLRKGGGDLTMKSQGSNNKGDKRPLQYDDPTEP